MREATTCVKRSRPSWTWIYGLAALTCAAAMASLNANAEEVELHLIDKVELHTTKPKAPPGPADFLPRRSLKEEKILAALGRTTEVAFRDNDLTSALEHLKEMHEIEIWIDANHLNIDNLNVTLEISDVSLRSCLNLLLEPLDLAYFIEDDTLKVTSQEIAAAKFITRIYPAGDLFSSPEEATELTNLLQTSLGLQPEAGVPNPISLSMKSRAIVLRQSHQMHDQLLQLLRTLREMSTTERITRLAPASDDSVVEIGLEQGHLGAKRSQRPLILHSRK